MIPEKLAREFFLGGGNASSKWFNNHDREKHHCNTVATLFLSISLCFETEVQES